MPNKKGLTFKQRRVHLWLRRLTKRHGKATIRQIAGKAFPGVRPVTKADSWVRNAFRELRPRGLAKQVGRGTYFDPTLDAGKVTAEVRS